MQQYLCQISIIVINDITGPEVAWARVSNRVSNRVRPRVSNRVRVSIGITFWLGYK